LAAATVRASKSLKKRARRNCLAGAIAFIKARDNSSIPQGIRPILLSLVTIGKTVLQKSSKS
jgi:hypothetical protein